MTSQVAAGSVGAMFPLPEPADLVIASHFTFDDISGDIFTLETRLTGICDCVDYCCA